MAASEQHMVALERANAIRLRRVAIKRKVKAGLLKLPDLIRAVPSELEGIRVAELLCAQERWGVVRTRTFLAGLHVGEHRKLGTLTERQREELATVLRESELKTARKRNGR